jgi:hypothetical protein
MIKKSGLLFFVLNKTAHLKMLPEFYLNCLKSQLSASQLLTFLKSLSEALKVYQARSGIEAMFRDCKSGGYNLEDSKASVARLTSLVLLIALAYTCAGLQGQFIKLSGQQKYVSRLKELKRMTRRHSNFWVGLYGQMWIAALEACSDWVTQSQMSERLQRTLVKSKVISP